MILNDDICHLYLIRHYYTFTLFSYGCHAQHKYNTYMFVVDLYNLSIICHGF